MIKILSKEDCCGCTACFNICPQKAISMNSDIEGFLYPCVETDNCIECGACERVCPVFNKKVNHDEVTEGYIIRNKNSKVVFESTSGGAFTALSEYVLHKNGGVYGAGYDESMRVVCKKATNTNQLKEMRGSKFVQATLGDVFHTVQEDISNKKIVLYSGTPCQISGLLSYLGKKPDNLICVDFVCRGVPSPGLWDNYIKYMESKYGSKIVAARFKHKTYGYHTTTMKIDFENGKSYYASGRVDPYMKAFVSELSSRPSCSVCAFKGIERPSDITLFDCYEYSKVTGKSDDDNGYSSLFIHTLKGKKIFDKIKDQILYSQEDVEKLVSCNGIMVCNCAKPHKKRAEFYEKAARYSIDQAINMVVPITAIDKMIESAKSTLYKTGLIKVVRKMTKRRKVEIVTQNKGGM